MMQVLAVSSAAAAFESMSDVPPLSLGTWRLQLTSVLLLPGAMVCPHPRFASVNQTTLTNPGPK